MAGIALSALTASVTRVVRISSVTSVSPQKTLGSCGLATNLMGEVFKA